MAHQMKLPRAFGKLIDKLQRVLHGAFGQTPMLKRKDTVSILLPQDYAIDLKAIDLPHLCSIARHGRSPMLPDEIIDTAPKHEAIVRLYANDFIGWDVILAAIAAGRPSPRLSLRLAGSAHADNRIKNNAI
jgi:hypothetical protein